MKNRQIFTVGTAIPSVAAVLFLAATPVAAQQFEKPPVLQASRVLPANLVRGPHHTVEETVRNDGVMNGYRLKTPQGTLSITGTDRLYLRIDETTALQKMHELSQTKVFKDALVRSVKAPIRFAGDMIDAPIKTIGNVGEGIGDFASSIGHSLFGGASDSESGAVETVVGYDIIKRRFAFQFRVDPYTTNRLVQERLVELSRAAFAGGLPMKVGTQFMPDAAKAAISVTGFAYGMSQLVRDKSPTELKKINGAKLAAMGVDGPTAEKFLEHPHFSPTKKTYITHALERMNGAADRKKFIGQATLATDEQLAFFYQRQAEVMAGYHANVSPVARILVTTNLVFMQRRDGAVVGVFPVDYLIWRQRSAASSTQVNTEFSGMSGITGKELWFVGSASPLYKKNMAALGWKIQDNARAKLTLK